MAGRKPRRKGLYACCSRAVPLVDPTSNDLPVGRRLFHSHLHQSLRPLAMPLAVFIERLEDLTQRMIVFSESKVADMLSGMGAIRPMYAAIICRP
jgi:hypothetical protein